MQMRKTLQGKEWFSYAICFLVNLLSFAAGTHEFDPSVPQNEKSWMMIGKIISLPLFGYLVNAVGRRIMLIVAAISFLLNSVLILTENLYLTYAAYLFAGIGCSGVYIILPIYIGEVAKDHVRGYLGSHFYLFYLLGVYFTEFEKLLALHTSTLALVTKSLPVLTLVTLIWLPDTPFYLLANNRKEEAFKALKRLRGNDVNDEFENLVLLSSIKNIISSIATVQALVISYALLIVQSLSFIFIDKVYYNETFLHLPQVSEYLGMLSLKASPLFVILDLGAAVAAIILIERLGRKLLLSVSIIGMASSLLWFVGWSEINTLANVAENSTTLKKLNFAENNTLQYIDWIPLTSYGIYAISFSFGIGPLPVILISEIFNVNARGPAVSFYFFVHDLIQFLLDYKETIYSSDVNTLIIIWALIGFLIAYFVHKMLPETKGQSLAIILRKLGTNEENIKGRFLIRILKRFGPKNEDNEIELHVKE